jgi:hypothetical protein
MVLALRPEVKMRQVERKKTIATAAKTARKTELDMLQTMSYSGVVGELQHICQALLAVAQKYVPHSPAAFTDATSVVRCAKALENMNLQPILEPHFKAHVVSAKSDSVRNSFEYRYLRNKAIAGFATIADLTAKPSAVGTLEYQNGVREGYLRASEIAIMFLDDIQNEVD